MAGATQVSSKGAAALLASEGLALGGYLDSQKVWTIGVGHTASAGAPNPADYANKKMQKRAAMVLFLTIDLPRYTADVLRVVKRPLLQHELDALVHFNYNIGITQFSKSNVLRAVNAGDNAAAAKGFLAWVKQPELTGRRQKERAMFLGSYPDHELVAVYPGGIGGPLGRATPTLASELMALVIGPQEPVEPVARPPVVFTPPLPQDEPQEPSAPVVIPPTTPTLGNGVDPRVQAAQRELIRVGFKLEPDGRMGSQTIGVMAAFRATFGLTGVANQVDAALEAKLKETADGYFQPAPERAAATPEQAAARSETVQKVTFYAWARRKFTDAIAAVFAVLGIDSQTDAIGFFSGRWDKLTSTLGMVPGWVWVLVILGGYIVYRELARRTTEAVVVQAFKSGDIIGGDKKVP